MPFSDDDFDPDAEGPSEQDIARFSSTEFRCIQCGEMLYAGVDLCSQCGAVQFHERDLSGLRNPLLRHPLLLVAVVVITIVAFLLIVL